MKLGALLKTGAFLRIGSILIKWERIK